MFDFSFLELVVIMAVALIVVGPQQLPEVARMLGQLWVRARRHINGVMADIDRDTAIREFRQLQQRVQAEADMLGKSTRQTIQALDNQMRQADGALPSLPIGCGPSSPGSDAASRPNGDKPE